MEVGRSQFLVSVILPTFRPREDVFSRVINSLKEQTLSRCSWEILLVENGERSIDSPQTLIEWHPQAKYIFQGRAGLTPARITGFCKTTAPVICMVDDDTELPSDYLEAGLSILDSFPKIGAWGGRLKPEFESEVSDRARAIWSDELNEDCWSSFINRSAAPVGGGMFLQRSVAESYKRQVENDPVRKALDRTGSGLSSAGDIDLAFCACDVSLGIGRFKSLELKHYISLDRCTDEYLDRLVEGFGYSETMLQFARDQKLPFSGSTIDRLVFRYKQLRSLGRRTRNQQCREKGIRKALAEIRRLGNQKLVDVETLTSFQ